MIEQKKGKKMYILEYLLSFRLNFDALDTIFNTFPLNQLKI